MVAELPVGLELVVGGVGALGVVVAELWGSGAVVFGGAVISGVLEVWGAVALGPSEVSEVESVGVEPAVGVVTLLPSKETTVVLELRPSPGPAVSRPML